MANNDTHKLNEILTRIALGGSLVEYCRENSYDYTTVFRWIHDNEDYATRYEKALELRQEHAKDELIRDMLSMLRADVTEAFDTDGNLLKISEFPTELRRLVAGVKYREIFELQGRGEDRQRVHVGNIIEVKFWDKPRSMEVFMKHLRMLDTSTKLDVSDTLAALLIRDTDKGEQHEQHQEGGAEPLSSMPGDGKTGLPH